MKSCIEVQKTIFKRDQYFFTIVLTFIANEFGQCWYVENVSFGLNTTMTYVIKSINKLVQQTLRLFLCDHCCCWKPSFYFYKHIFVWFSISVTDQGWLLKYLSGYSYLKMPFVHDWYAFQIFGSNDGWDCMTKVDVSGAFLFSVFIELRFIYSG